MDPYQTLIRPILFSLPAESAHTLGKWALRRGGFWRAMGNSLRAEHSRLRHTAGRLDLANPVGLAPGFDKDCEMLAGLSQLGFGYLEVGTIMPGIRQGNPRPRLHRYEAQGALVNCMGLPSRGVAYCVKQLEAWARRKPANVPVIVSFMGFTSDEYLHVFAALEPAADALELALRCPNTPDEPNFVDPQAFASLLSELSPLRHKPLFVKLPSLDIEVNRDQLRALVAQGLRHGIDGFVVSGTYPVTEPRLSMGRGSLSGRPTLARTLEAVQEVYRHTANRAALVAQGGITSGKDAFAAIAAGASSVSLYTGFVYEGPGVAGKINAELLALMESHGIRSVGALRGQQAAAVPSEVDLARG